MPIDKPSRVVYNPGMKNPTNENDLPHDWDLDMQYEDRFACLGDFETADDWSRYGFDPTEY